MARKKKDNRSQREKMDKIRKSSRRKALLDLGVYMIHKPKVMKDKKKYSRKNKPKPDTEE